MHFPHIRLVTVRYTGDLHMAHVRELCFQIADQIALDDLAVVEIELHLEVGGADPGENLACLRLATQIEAGHVARVDRFDQQCLADLLKLCGGVTQVAEVGLGATGPHGVIRPLRHQSRHGMYARTIECLGIANRLGHRGPKLLLAARQTGQAALTGLPVARRQIEQHLRQLVCIEPCAQFFRGIGIGEEIFDPAKTAVGRSREAIEKIMLGEQHAEIGGQSGHVRSLDVTDEEVITQGRPNLASSSATCSGVIPRGFLPCSSRNSLAVSSSSSVV